MIDFGSEGDFRWLERVFRGKNDVYQKCALKQENNENLTPSHSSHPHLVVGGFFWDDEALPDEKVALVHLNIPE